MGQKICEKARLGIIFQTKPIKYRAKWGKKLESIGQKYVINSYHFEKLQIQIHFTFSKVKAGTRSSSTDCKQSKQTDSSKTKRCTEFDSTVAISQTFIHTSSIFQTALDSRTIFILLRFHEIFSSLFQTTLDFLSCF